jgi:hypothetical protein
VPASFRLGARFADEVVVEIQHADGCAVCKHRIQRSGSFPAADQNTGTGASFCGRFYGACCGFARAENGAANRIQQQEFRAGELLCSHRLRAEIQYRSGQRYGGCSLGEWMHFAVNCPCVFTVDGTRQLV